MTHRSNPPVFDPSSISLDSDEVRFAFRKDGVDGVLGRVNVYPPEKAEAFTHNSAALEAFITDSGFQHIDSVDNPLVGHTHYRSLESTIAAFGDAFLKAGTNDATLDETEPAQDVNRAGSRPGTGSIRPRGHQRSKVIDLSRAFHAHNVLAGVGGVGFGGDADGYDASVPTALQSDCDIDGFEWIESPTADEFGLQGHAATAA